MLSPTPRPISARSARSVHELPPNEGDGEGRPKTTLSRTVVIVLVLGCLSSICTGMFHSGCIPAVLEPIKHEFNATSVEGGLLVSAYDFAALPTALISGRFDYHRRLPMVVGLGLILAAGAAALLSLAPSLWLAGLGHAVYGIGVTPLFVLQPVWFDDNLRLSRGHVSTFMGVLNGAFPLGTATGFIVGGWLAEHQGWRTAGLVLGIPIVVCGILWLFVPRFLSGLEPDDRDVPLLELAGPKDGDHEGHFESPQKHRNDTHGKRRNGAFEGIVQDAKELFTNAPFVSVFIGVAATFYCVISSNAWLPSFVKDTFNVSLARAGLLCGACVVPGAVVGSVLGGVLHKWRPTAMFAYQLCAIATFVGAVASFCVPFVTNLVLWCVVFTATMFILFWESAPAQTLALCVVPGHLRGSSLGAVAFGFKLFGNIPGPIVLGFLLDRMPAKLAFSLSGGIGFVVSFLAFAIGCVVYRRQAAQQLPLNDEKHPPSLLDYESDNEAERKL